MRSSTSASSKRLLTLSRLAKLLYVMPSGACSLAGSGEVRGFVDLSRLLTPEERNRLNSEEVLNGIAHDPNGDCMYVTGKNWPKLFKIAVPRLPAHSAEDPAQD